jgi:hypothetical protein
MKFTNPDADYYKLEGFEAFRQAFKEVYEKSDYEVIKVFAPLAKQIAEKELPTLQTTTPNKRFGLETLLESIRPVIDSVLSPIPQNIKHQKDRTDISVDETVATTNFLAKKIAPSLQLKLHEMLRDDKLSTNKEMDTSFFDQRIKELQEKLEKDPNVYEQERLEELLETRKRISETLVGSHYCPDDNEINLKQTYTQEDAIVLIHELAHAEVSLGNSTLIESPAITAEFLADNYMKSQSLGGLDRTIERFVDMQKTCVFITAADELFSKYESSGDITHADMETFRKQAYPDDFEEKSPEHYYPADITFTLMPVLHASKYFIGTGSAFALAPQIKNSKDLQNVFDAFNRKDLSDAQKLEELGITHENMITSINTFVAKNKEHLKLL